MEVKETITTEVKLCHTFASVVQITLVIHNNADEVACPLYTECYTYLELM